jgi:cytochrome d ubiquinol oxidase subunit II
MLGHYVTGLQRGWQYQVFSATIALALPAAYALIGACWLILKTEEELQRRAVHWARQAWLPVVLGMGLISVVTPLVSPTVRSRWFRMPEFIVLLPIPLMTAVALVALLVLLNSGHVLGRLCWMPFALVVAVFVLGFVGLAYSLYPYVVVDRLTLWQAASSPESLKIILVGVAVTVPAIAAYTVLAYRVFRGKARDLRYG